MFLPRLVAVLAIACGIASPTLAIETGSAGWLIKGQSLYEGPGVAYDVVGELGDETRIRVDRCTYRWCLIHAEGEKGWVSRDNVGFGQEPRGPFTGPRLDYPAGGPGEVCFFEGHSYSGNGVCAKSGTVVHDLLLFDLDNRYSSIQITGNVSVTICRDRDFSSYCERVIESQPRLNGFLDNNVSSYQVW